MSGLPFHCPVLRSDHLLRPCGKNLKQAKNLMEKKEHLGLLELCRECKGKKLEVKDLTINAFCEIHPGQRLELMRGRPVKGTPAGLRMKCPKCVLPVWATQPSPPVAPVPQEKDIGVPPGTAVSACASPPLPPQFPCKKHPEVESKIDSLGRSMGLCEKCLSDRGRASGLKGQYSGKTGPPVSIPLNQEKFADLKAWLEKQAADNERTLNQEIMFRLKMAMRLALQSAL